MSEWPQMWSGWSWWEKNAWALNESESDSWPIWLIIHKRPSRGERSSVGKCMGLYFKSLPLIRRCPQWQDARTGCLSNTHTEGRALMQNPTFRKPSFCFQPWFSPCVRSVSSPTPEFRGHWRCCYLNNSNCKIEQQFNIQAFVKHHLVAVWTQNAGGSQVKPTQGDPAFPPHITCILGPFTWPLKPVHLSDFLCTYALMLNSYIIFKASVFCVV